MSLRSKNATVTIPLDDYNRIIRAVECFPLEKKEMVQDKDIIETFYTIIKARFPFGTIADDVISDLEEALRRLGLR
jgi:hypothetical protein